jgi:hypothetical protein
MYTGRRSLTARPANTASGSRCADSSTVADPKTPSHPQAALDAARALWATEDGRGYDMNFNWRCLCTTEHVQPVDLEVRHRALTAGAGAADGAALNADRLAEYRTVEGLFVLIQRRSATVPRRST